MKKSSPYLERVPRNSRRPAARPASCAGPVAALLVLGGILLAVAGIVVHQQRAQECAQQLAAERQQTAADAQANADRAAGAERETRRTLLAALSDPRYVAAHPEAAVAALERLAAAAHGSEAGEFRDQVEGALSAARAHLDTPVTTAMEVRARPRN